MKILHRYILSAFITTFVVALFVFTFVMSITVIFKAADLIAKGATWQPIARMFLYGIPSALGFSIPISVLVSVLLVFGRMSADGEITAMRASGIGLWEIASAPLLASVVLALLCMFINTELSPKSHLKRRAEQMAFGEESPIELIEDGTFIREFDGMTVYVGRRKGSEIQNVRIYDLRDPRNRQEIRAQSGTITLEGSDLLIDLRDVRLSPNPYNKGPGELTAGRWPYRIPDALKSKELKKKAADFTFSELFARIRQPAAYYLDLGAADLQRQAMMLVVELNKRMVLSLACVSFVLLGVPLGIKTHRKESSAGIGLSLFLVFNFYLFVIVAESLAKYPGAPADLLLWIPLLVCSGAGSLLIQRAS